MKRTCGLCNEPAADLSRKFRDIPSASISHDGRMKRLQHVSCLSKFHQAEPPVNHTVKTVLEIDLASYSDIARLLEENIGVHAVKELEDQVQSFVDEGLKETGLKRDETVLGTAGDNAILVFDEPEVVHQFAVAV